MESNWWGDKPTDKEDEGMSIVLGIDSKTIQTAYGGGDHASFWLPTKPTESSKK